MPPKPLPRQWARNETGKSQAVLQVVRRRGVATKLDIAADTGLTKANVTALCAGLQNCGTLRRIREPWAKGDWAAWEIRPR
jgi:DNA-binding IclR family transcriptional regulator